MIALALVSEHLRVRMALVDMENGNVRRVIDGLGLLVLCCCICRSLHVLRELLHRKLHHKDTNTNKKS